MMRLIVSLLLIASSTTLAHRSHFGWTEITQAGETIEITHRFHEHDVALLVAKLRAEKPGSETNPNASQAVDMTSLENQARFALYVEQSFAIHQDGQLLPLTLIGAELKHHYVFVYQELAADRFSDVASLPDNLAQGAGTSDLKSVNERAYTVTATMLMSLFDDQIHVVDVKLNDLNRTIKFTAETHSQALMASHAHTH